jgi:aromatic ring-opening dioxygenase catalytic subunit (LigB family)
MRQPTFFIPHGGGPCFFMDDPQGVWTGMEAFLKSLPSLLPERPSAILVVSGHWETDGFAFTGSASPNLLFDYSGFPPHTYELRFDVPGAPELARTAARLLEDAGIMAQVDSERGFDHGVFVPLKVAFPGADVPVVEMSVERNLDPELHQAAGRALSPLRDQGVVIIASGMSFHNMHGYGDRRFTQPSIDFDQWLAESVAMSAHERAVRLNQWQDAPAGRLSHPREEHLLPLMVAAGAADEAGERLYGEQVLETLISGFRFK